MMMSLFAGSLRELGSGLSISDGLRERMVHCGLCGLQAGTPRVRSLSLYTIVRRFEDGSQVSELTILPSEGKDSIHVLLLRSNRTLNL